MQLRWAHAVVYVKDLDTMLDFYTNVLGFEVTDRGPVGESELVFMSQVDTDHHQLAFMPTRTDSERSNTVNHFAFRVASVEDVKALHQTLQSDDRVKGIRPVCHGNAWSVYFADPEGNGIEVFCDTPWHVQQPQGRPWDTSLDEDALRAATEAEFASEPEFGPIDAFYAERAAHLSDREASARGSAK